MADNSLNDLMNQIDSSRLPQHVAMIMDGNGRWATQRGQNRSAGHIEGVATVHRVTEFSSDLGIKYLTLYAFSTENWNRPDEEVETLMHLIGWAIERELPDLIKNNVRLNLIGDIDRIPETPRRKILDAQAQTANCTGLNLQICLSYSSRWEIVETAKNLAKKCIDSILSPDDFDEHLFAESLQTASFPDPDLLIRTGGEQRISNFLLWQLAYSELYFCDTLWPDFDNEAYAKAIIDFQHRERRFGKTSQQINSSQND